QYSPVGPPLSAFTNKIACELCKATFRWVAVAGPGCVGDAARRAASPVLRQAPCRAGRAFRCRVETRPRAAPCSSERPLHPSDYQSLCLNGTNRRSAKLLISSVLLRGACQIRIGSCSSLLQKGCQLVVNDCRAS